MKISIYLHLIFAGHNHIKAKHIAFHKQHETWELLHFAIHTAPDFFISTHAITCSKCNYVYTVKRSWPKQWTKGIGNTLAEAHRKAKRCNQYS